MIFIHNDNPKKFFLKKSTYKYFFFKEPLRFNIIFPNKFLPEFLKNPDANLLNFFLTKPYLLKSTLCRKPDVMGLNFFKKIYN